jgi:hypothetical protein
MAQSEISLKFGWLSLHIARRAVGPLLAATACLAAAPGASAAQILFARGGWAAIDFGSRCEARSRALWPKAGTEPFAGFTFDRSHAGPGRFYAHLSRRARTGAAVIASVGSEPFLLGSNGEWAWSRDPRQQRALLDAARYGQTLSVESRDGSGRRFVDHYALAAAPTAIDSAAAACAKAGKSG